MVNHFWYIIYVSGDTVYKHDVVGSRFRNLQGEIIINTLKGIIIFFKGVYFNE